MRVLFLSIVLLSGVVTRYDADDHDVLRCSPLGGGERYGTIRSPFVAMPISQMGEIWECGSKALLYIDGYPPMRVTVYDSGALGNNYVQQIDGTLLPIIADLPTRFAPFAPDLSAKASILVNVVGDHPMLVR